MEPNFNAHQTFFAPAERASMDEVLRQNAQLKEASFLEEVFAKIPIMFLILNEQRQIVYLNSLLATEFESKKFSHTLGYRPGEILQCENAAKEEGGCGTAKACRFCGIVNTVIEAIKENKLVVHDAFISTDFRGMSETVNYEVSAKPFDWSDTRFTIVTLSDNSYKKQKEQLERTFFHDLLNKVSSISGMIDMLVPDSDDENIRLMNMLKRGVIDMASEIRYQRNLVLAEKGELKVTSSRINSIDIINYVKESFYPYETVWNKKIEVLPESQSFNFFSDSLLLNRIFSNLIKNSLEAIESGEKIEISITQKDGNMLFSVKNNVVLAEDIKYQIYRRTFSSKNSNGHGIGTYSVKLFTEIYLKGKTWFTSTPEEGTIFYVELPLSIDEESLF